MLAPADSQSLTPIFLHLIQHGLVCQTLNYDLLVYRYVVLVLVHQSSGVERSFSDTQN